METFIWKSASLFITPSSNYQQIRDTRLIFVILGMLLCGELQRRLEQRTRQHQRGPLLPPTPMPAAGDYVLKNDACYHVLVLTFCRVTDEVQGLVEGCLESCIVLYFLCDLLSDRWLFHGCLGHCCFCVAPALWNICFVSHAFLVQEVFGWSFGSYTDFLSCSGERGLFKLDLVLKCYYALDWPVKCVSASTSSLWYWSNAMCV